MIIRVRFLCYSITWSNLWDYSRNKAYVPAKLFEYVCANCFLAKFSRDLINRSYSKIFYASITDLLLLPILFYSGFLIFLTNKFILTRLLRFWHDIVVSILTRFPINSTANNAYFFEERFNRIDMYFEYLCNL